MSKERQYRSNVQKRTSQVRTFSRLARFARLANERRLLRGHLPLVGYICGHGEANVGDDIMLMATREALLPSKLVVLAHPRQERRLSLLGLSGHSYFRSVLLGGGTLVNPNWLEQARTALRLGTPLWSLGTGVGSSGFAQREETETAEWASLLRQFNRIGVRGPLSLERLAQLGLRESVEIVGDVALLLTREFTLPAATPPKVLVNLALQAVPEFEPEVVDTERRVARLLTRLAAGGFDIRLVAMHPSDVGRLWRLREALGLQSLPIHRPTSAVDFFRLVEDCLLAIAVRLHASVLSCCAGVPVLSLGYRDKCLDFMRSMHLEDWCIDLRDRSSRAGVESHGLQLVDEAGELRQVVLQRALEWRSVLLGYIARASHLYATSTH